MLIAWDIYCLPDSLDQKTIWARFLRFRAFQRMYSGYQLAPYKLGRVCIHAMVLLNIHRGCWTETLGAVRALGWLWCQRASLAYHVGKPDESGYKVEGAVLFIIG